MIEPCRDEQIAQLANIMVCRGERLTEARVASLGKLVLENEAEERAFVEHYREIAIALGREALLE